MNEITDLGFDEEYGIYAVIITVEMTAWKWVWSCDCGFKTARQYFVEAEIAWRSAERWKEEFTQIPLEEVLRYKKPVIN